MQRLANSRPGFKTAFLHRRREPHPGHFLAQKTSFWVAVLSLFAFVTGNMMGQHGWHVFWKSVMGKYDESLIVYTGTVPPLATVPDYSRWRALGGDPSVHSFRQVPKDLLIPLPVYGSDSDAARAIFSVAHLGDYVTGEPEKGSHLGADILAPEGTPVQSIMHGLVVRADNDAGGFGKVIVVKHPRVPDPENPTKTTTLYSVYAHLSSIFVTEGSPVSKGETIGLTGSTGLASGKHLHFQLERDIGTDGTETPWHPYWPFTTTELREAGLNFNEAINTAFHQERGKIFTVDPLRYVQANFRPIEVVDAAGVDASSSSPSVSRPRIRRTFAERRAERIRLREARRLVAVNTAPKETPLPPLVVSSTTVAEATPGAPPTYRGTAPVSVDLLHDGAFSRTWERITVRLIDASGNSARPSDLPGDLYFRTAYGSAEFRPEVLSSLDFNERGEATVQMLPRGRSTVVILVQPIGAMSDPMRYVKE